jgi:hypothetical protein
VILAPRDEEERSTVGVLVVHVRVVGPGMDVRERAAPEDAARCGDVVALVQPPRLFFAECVRERVAPLLEGEPDGLVAVGGVLENGNVDLICDSGTRLTPSVGAELMATPAAP